MAATQVLAGARDFHVNACTGLSDIYLSNQCKAYALDGRQQPFTLLLASQRISNLGIALKTTSPGASKAMGRAGDVASVTALVQIMAMPLLKFGFTIMAVASEKRQYIALKGAQFIEAVNKQLNKVGDVIDPLVNAAAFVSYVAMIALGHRISGAIGLASLMLIAIKRLRLLPATLDSVLDITGQLASVYLILFSQQSLLTKIPAAIHLMTSFLSHLLNSKHFVFLFSKLLKERPYIDTDPSTVKLEEYLLDPSKHGDLQFELNKASFNAKEVSQVFPPDFRADLAKSSLKELYSQIEEKMGGEVLVTKAQKTGWNNLKKGILSKRVVDTPPPHLDRLIQHVKAIFYIYSQDGVSRENFVQTMQDFARVGNKCSEGWSRDISFLLHPSSKDYKWAVHHYHSVFRGELLKEAMRMSDSAYDNQFTKSLGGVDDVHVTNQVQAALEHRWHSYEAKLFFSIHGRTFMQQVWRMLLPRSFSKPYLQGSRHANFSESMLMSAIADLPINVFFYAMVDGVMREIYTKERLISAIHDKVTPQYRESVQGGQHSLEVFREIEWSTIATWLADINRRGLPIITDSGRYRSEYVEKDPAGNYFLTEKAITFLLWDLGILKAYPGMAQSARAGFLNGLAKRFAIRS